MVAGRETHPLDDTTVRAEATTFVGIGWPPVAGDIHRELLQHEIDEGWAAEKV
jgi:hypothetical protein